MEIREATEGDVPAIVGLLKISLGEGLTPKSEAYWRWKHIENPFGPSPVLLCWENNELIGVRAFLRWQWVHRGRIYRAVRAVDTATHPDHQGKGIFKRLTLSLVDSCKRAGDDFIFNTPNEKSKPGYLKMGWSEAGKLPIGIGIRRPIRMMVKLVSRQAIDREPIPADIASLFKAPGLESLLSDAIERDDALITNATVSYLRWRYLDVPVAEYVSVEHSKDDRVNGLIIGRLKRSKFGTELRITDCFTRDTQGQKDLKRKFLEKVREWDVDYVATSGFGVSTTKAIVPTAFKVPIGPTVTIRPLALEQLDNLNHFSRWRPSLGDLELF